MSRTRQPASPSPGISEEADLSLSSMEGIAAEPRRKPSQLRFIYPGVLAALLVAVFSYAIHFLPFAPFRIAGEHGFRRPVSASIIAIMAGVLARNLFRLPSSVASGCKTVTRRLLPITIVLTGAGLNLTDMAGVGFRALAITVVCLCAAAGSAFYLGQAMGLRRRTAVLIGAGTAICGTSAIIAVAPLIHAEDEDITLSVGTINLLGIVLMFLFPLFGGALHLGDKAFGVWAGTSIHAVPQAVAAGFAYSEAAGGLATLVKLVRVTMLAPFIVVLMFLYTRSGPRTPASYSRPVPTFIWGFAAMAILNTTQFFPTLQFHLAQWLGAREFTVPLAAALVEGGNYILTFVMAAMGLEVHIGQLASGGGKALAVGTISAVVLCLTSLALIRILL